MQIHRLLVATIVAVIGCGKVRAIRGGGAPQRHSADYYFPESHHGETSDALSHAERRLRGSSYRMATVQHNASASAPLDVDRQLGGHYSSLDSTMSYATVTTSKQQTETYGHGGTTMHGGAGQTRVGHNILLGNYSHGGNTAFSDSA